MQGRKIRAGKFSLEVTGVTGTILKIEAVRAIYDNSALDLLESKRPLDSVQFHNKPAMAVEGISYRRALKLRKLLKQCGFVAKVRKYEKQD